MEQQRMAFALFLVFLVWFGWMMLQAATRPHPVNAPANANAPANVAPPANVPPGNGGGTHPAPEGAFRHPEVAERSWTVKTEKYEIEFTNRGGAIKNLTLRGLLDRRGGEPFKLLQDFNPDRLSLTTWDAALGRSAATTPWETLEDLKEGELARMRFTYPNGLELTKSFSVDPKRYALVVRVTARNRDEKNALPHQLEVLGPGGVTHDSQDESYHHGVHARSLEEERWEYDESLTLDKAKKGVEPIPGKKAHWGGVTSKYFAAVLAPHQRDKIVEIRFDVLTELKSVEIAKQKFRTENGPDVPLPPEAELIAKWSANLTASAKMQPVTIEAKGEATHEFTVYAGPRRAADLDPWRKEFGFDRLLDYGWFTAIANLLLLILNGFYSIFGNYGVAIICLTIMVKVCLFPLTKKAQVSAFKMQQMQPKMLKLRELYEDDKQKLNHEMLKMYKEHGVNPLGGCLPMFFQIPVFIGLYNGLQLNFELRQQPFVSWIQDLARPDHLATLPFNLPILGTNEFNLLPILMTITWFIQSATQPKSPDPAMAQQQKIFMFMPIMFGFMLYPMPSGLILYWFTSTLLAIGEQQFIKRRYLK